MLLLYLDKFGLSVRFVLHRFGILKKLGGQIGLRLLQGMQLHFALLKEFQLGEVLLLQVGLGLELRFVRLLCFLERLLQRLDLEQSGHAVGLVLLHTDLRDESACIDYLQVWRDRRHIEVFCDALSCCIVFY